MRQATARQSPSIVSDIGALAGLYRTVFWMIGRKSSYGRIWPPEAEMGPAEEAVRVPPVITVAETTRHATVEIGTRD
ncbi:MAG TPA: hypothetical protein VGR43_06065 [Dehalococcoidia bacterium]|jgi:hypothetical protein|nr:hypothetical protein [Dehalococcoidia bacterium]